MQCPFPAKDETRILNLSQLKRNSRKRVDKKGGLKKPRTNDYEVNPAPDSSKVLDLTTDSQVNRSVVEHDAPQDVSCLSSADQPATSITPVISSTPSRVRSKAKFHVTFEKVTNDLLSDLDTSAPVDISDKKGRKRLSLRKPTKLIDEALDADLIDVHSKINQVCTDNQSIEQTSNQRRFWVPAYQLSFQDKFTIQSGKWLDDVVINAAHDMMHEQFPLINGMQHCTLAPRFSDDKHQWEIPKKSFQRTATPSVQIHYTGHSHWVTSFQRAGDSRVFLLDSLVSGYPELPASLQIQLAQIYGSSDGQLVIHVPSLNTQVMGSDCGLYAIANMFEFCHGAFSNVPEEKLTWEFRQDGLRSHLINCFSCDHFSNFPHREKKVPAERKTTSYAIQVLCHCGLPNQFLLLYLIFSDFS